ncbi:glycosyltransferase [Mycolicibacterium monacense]|uniref:glycosyltransferase n=1 Tax=Mycolicibacterium monacense TaxID=85693 RepID=UPI000A0C57E4|nr:glycosyltransferase [Mycolicibacterium monacense]ORB21460.1 glycosyl transferase family 1 [Mycolicibacterium monacense DSM 44395]
MSVPDVAIAHDYLTQRGGAERVVLAMARTFPRASIYTTLYDPNSTYPEFQQRDIRASWLNRFAIFRRSHRAALPLLAAAVSSTRVDAESLIVSTSGWAHGYRVPGAKIVYCHSPARWLYQTDAYFGTRAYTPRRIAVEGLRPFLERWDRRNAATASKYFANSTEVMRRIKATYGIEAEVLPAPHSIRPGVVPDEPDLPKSFDSSEGFYLCVSRLLPYKNVDVLVEAVSSLNYPLVIVGAGPEERRLRRSVRANVVMLKDLTDRQMYWLYARCTALLSASYEDYGLTPVEAAAFGKPSVVLRWGGFLDTVVEGETGLFFDQPTPDHVRAALIRSRKHLWDSRAIESHADEFSEVRFAERLVSALSELT